MSDIGPWRQVHACSYALKGETGKVMVTVILKSEKLPSPPREKALLKEGRKPRAALFSGYTKA